jgi:hypothetical protein
LRYPTPFPVNASQHPVLDKFHKRDPAHRSIKKSYDPLADYLVY